MRKVSLIFALAAIGGIALCGAARADAIFTAGGTIGGNAAAASADFAISGNLLTIAFAADASSTSSTEDAFRKHAPKSLRPHISDIMQTNRNAVLVWTTTPDPTELDTATRCLQP